MKRRLRAVLVISAIVVGTVGCAHRGSRMMAEDTGAMAQRQAKLDELVSTMNAADGAARIDAIAAVVNELAAQHKAMHSRMRSRHPMPGRP